MLDWLLSLAQTANHPLGLLVLFASSAIEYVFPPFPGDTVTILGAVLITAHHWSGPLVLALTTAGSLLGAWIDYQLGALARRKLRGAQPETQSATLAKILEKFSRYGELYIVINRFLPGIRAAFFYAAGLTGMRLGRVLFFAGISALVWNLLLIALGAGLGANLEDLLSLAQRYTLVVWLGLGLLAVVWLARWLVRRAKSQQKAD